MRINQPGIVHRNFDSAVVIDLSSLSFILLMNSNRKGRGGGLKKEVGAYVYFLPMKKEGLLERLELRGGGYLRGGA